MVATTLFASSPRRDNHIMGGTAYRGRSQLATGWRSLLLIAIFCGAMFGAATTAALAARRTASAYTRFAHASNAWEAMYINYEADETAILTADELREIPGVEAVHAVRYEFAPIGPGTAYLADRSGRLGTDIAAARLLEGRWFEPDAANEAVISFALAEREGFVVGDRFQLFPPELLDMAESPEERAFGEALLAAAPDAMIEIVGIAATPGQFPPLINPGVPLMQLSPGFAALPEASPNEALLVQLHPHTDVDAFRTAVDQLAAQHGQPPSLGVHRDLVRDVNRSLRPQVAALAMLTLVLALAAAVVGGQAVARRADLDSGDDDTLRAIGLTSGDLRRIAALQWAVVGVVAALIAVAVTIALSPLSPSGLARVAEPSPGARADVPALAVGFVVTAGAVFVGGMGQRALRSRRRNRVRTPIFARLPLHPLIGIGMRRAFDPGDGTRRVPVWSTVAGAMVGIAAVTAALTVGTTLARQLDDPARYGVRWEIELTQFTENTLATEGAVLLAEDERLTGVAAGIGGPTPMDGRETNLLAMDPVRGEVRPPLLRGTYPDGPDSVALGGRTFEQLGAEIGSQVELDFTDVGGAALPFRVVGEVLMPPQGIGGRMDEGLFFSLAGIRRALGADDAVVDTLFLAGAPGTDLDAIVEELVERIEPQEMPAIEYPTTPADLVDLGRARSMPTLFAAALALAGTASLTHALWVTFSRRRRESAVLRALGFNGRQFYVTALAQSCALTGVAVVIGVLLGTVVGRLAWDALASSIGSSLSADVPVLAVVVLLPLSAFALAAVLSLGVGWRSCRLQPAAVLRAE